MACCSQHQLEIKQIGSSKVFNDEEIFINKAKKAGLSREFALVQQVSNSLQSRCSSFTAIPFQHFVALKIMMADNRT